MIRIVLVAVVSLFIGEEDALGTFVDLVRNIG